MLPQLEILDGKPLIKKNKKKIKFTISKKRTKDDVIKSKLNQKNIENSLNNNQNNIIKNNNNNKKKKIKILDNESLEKSNINENNNKEKIIQDESGIISIIDNKDYKKNKKKNKNISKYFEKENTFIKWDD